MRDNEELKCYIYIAQFCLNSTDRFMVDPEQSIMEETIKKCIRSLLTSATSGLRMFELQRDYENTIGEPIPYQKLGFNSLDHYLRSIPDTVQVRGIGREAVLVPVITEKSSHINDLVAKQRVTKKGKNNRPIIPRQYFIQNAKYSQPSNTFKKIQYPHRPAATSSVAISSSATFQPMMKSETSSETKLPAKYTRVNWPPNNDVPENKHTKEATAIKTSSVSISKPVETLNLSHLGKDLTSDSGGLENKAEKACVSNDCTSFATSTTKFLREKFTTAKLNRSGEAVEQNRVAKNKTPCPSDTRTFSFRFAAPSGKRGGGDSPIKKTQKNNNGLSSMQNDSVPHYVQNNLRKLISKYPDGVWCAELPAIYRRMFNQEFRYLDYGFRSLIELCTSLTDIFHYARPFMDDFRLYDGTKPLPEKAEKKFTVASYSAGEGSCGNGLPSIDWGDVLKFVPKDIFPPGSDIPRVFVPESTKEYDVFGVVPGEIYDISKFWIFLDNGELDKLMDDIQNFYKVRHKEYYVPENIIKEGLYCVQIIFGEYHRALVVDTLPEIEGQIRLLYIDYGTVSKAPTKGLCFLHEQFAELPIQAIRCRLANIVPLLEGVPWSKESTMCFRKLIKGRTLKASVIKINWQDLFLDIFMVDVTNPDETFYINDRLVQEGFAQYPDKERKKYKVDSIFKCKVKQIHLFPTFVELEHGLAPSAIEMGMFDECSVPLHFVIPQYFEVDLTAENFRVESTAKEFQKMVKKKHEREINHFDIRQLKPKPIDLQYFGSMAKDITELPEFDMFKEAYELPSSCQENEEITYEVENSTNRVEIVKCAETLKQDCLLSQDIMKDLDDLVKLRSQLEFDESDEFWDVNDSPSSECHEDLDVFNNFVKEYSSHSEHEPSVGDMEDCDENEDVCNSLIDLGTEDYLTLPSKTSALSSNEDCDKDDENIDTNQIDSEGDATWSLIFQSTKKSTNPFLENYDDCQLETEESMENLVLNPNNPFLSGSLNKDYDDSSNSTNYTPACQEFRITQWSTEDSRSESLTTFDEDSNSSEQLQLGDNNPPQTVLQPLTQTEKELQPSLTAYHPNWSLGNDNAYNYCGYPLQQYMYHQQNTYAQPLYPGSLHETQQYFPSPYYHTETYFSPGTYYPPVTHLSSQHSSASGVIPSADSQLPMQNMPTVRVRPPPGFHANANVYQVRSYVQAVRSSVPAESCHNDFYDVYNAMLQLTLQNNWRGGNS